jgi:hypothetical protein
VSETPVVCLALPTLYDAVVARFDLDSTNVESHFGWREPQKHKTARARIVWVPGDEGGGTGNVDPARNPGGNPRSLATLRELFTVYIAADDPQFPENERSQYTATRLLFDAWVRAVYLAAHGTFSIESVSWNTSKNERRHGAELVCVCWIEALIPDAPYELAPPDTEADITTSLDDVDEQTTTATP